MHCERRSRWRARIEQARKPRLIATERTARIMSERAFLIPQIAITEPVVDDAIRSIRICSVTISIITSITIATVSIAAAE
jgi:hypothetical protein